MAASKKKASPELAEVEFEGIMSQLEDVVTQLESDDLPLETALSAYQTGVQLAAEGQRRLVAAEQKIKEITASGEIELDEPGEHDD